MKIALIIVFVAGVVGASMGLMVAWSNHKSDQAVQNSYTPLKDSGPAIVNPFSDIKPQGIKQP